MKCALANITRDHRPTHLQPDSTSHCLGLSVLAALVLGVLNPLFCVLHCSMIDTVMHRHAPSGSVRFVCHLSGISHAATAEQAHIPGQHSTAPRAVYDGVLMLLAMCIAFVILIARLTPTDRWRWNGESPAPPLPPPKLRHLLPVQV